MAFPNYFLVLLLLLYLDHVSTVPSFGASEEAGTAAALVPAVNNASPAIPPSAKNLLDLPPGLLIILRIVFAGLTIRPRHCSAVGGNNPGVQCLSYDPVNSTALFLANKHLTPYAVAVWWQPITFWINNSRAVSNDYLWKQSGLSDIHGWPAQHHENWEMKLYLESTKQIRYLERTTQVPFQWVWLLMDHPKLRTITINTVVIVLRRQPRGSGNQQDPKPNMLKEWCQAIDRSWAVGSSQHIEEQEIVEVTTSLHHTRALVPENFLAPLLLQSCFHNLGWGLLPTVAAFRLMVCDGAPYMPIKQQFLNPFHEHPALLYGRSQGGTRWLKDYIANPSGIISGPCDHHKLWVKMCVTLCLDSRTFGVSFSP